MASQPGALSFWSGNLAPRMHGFWRRLLHFSRPMRTLRLRESLALGERRFVAVIEFEKARFLIGGTASSLVLLSRLEDGASPCPGGEEYATGRIENTLRPGRECDPSSDGDRSNHDEPTHWSNQATDDATDGRPDRRGQRR